MSPKLLIAAIGGVSAILPAVAGADPVLHQTALTAVEAEFRVRVPISDVDPSTPAGIRTLQRRLSDAGRKACTTAFRDQPLETQQTNICLSRVNASSRQKLAAVTSGTQLAGRTGTQSADVRR